MCLENLKALTANKIHRIIDYKKDIRIFKFDYGLWIQSLVKLNKVCLITPYLWVATKTVNELYKVVAKWDRRRVSPTN